MEKISVGAGADLVDNVGLEIAVNGTRNVLALAGLGEEGAEAVVSLLSLALISEEAIGLLTRSVS